MKETKVGKLRKQAQRNADTRKVVQTQSNPLTKELKLLDKVAVITGGNSQISRAIALRFAEEGADIVVICLKELSDVSELKRTIESYGRKCFLAEGNIENETFCQIAVENIINEYGKVDILVNNSTVYYESESIDTISAAQLLKTFNATIFSTFWFTQLVLPHMKKGSAIINSVCAENYSGTLKLADYSAAKGAVVAFTKSLSYNLVSRGIRVNGICADITYPPCQQTVLSINPVAFEKIAAYYVFLACEDSSNLTGQFLYPNRT